MRRSGLLHDHDHVLVLHNVVDAHELWVVLCAGAPDEGVLELVGQRAVNAVALRADTEAPMARWYH